MRCVLLICKPGPPTPGISWAVRTLRGNGHSFTMAHSEGSVASCPCSIYQAFGNCDHINPTQCALPTEPATPDKWRHKGDAGGQETPDQQGSLVIILGCSHPKDYRRKALKHCCGSQFPQFCETHEGKSQQSWESMASGEWWSISPRQGRAGLGRSAPWHWTPHSPSFSLHWWICQGTPSFIHIICASKYMWIHPFIY